MSSCALLLALAGLSAAPSGVRAQSTVTLSGTNLAAGTYTYDELVISGTVTVTGAVKIIANALTISASGSLVGVGRGSASSTGAGWSPDLSAGTSYQGKGGTHGGCAQEVVNGPDWTCPKRGLTVPYGSVVLPTDVGTGGMATRSGNAGGAGGAALFLDVAGSATIAGTVDVSGAPGGNGGGSWEAGGGGSGGSITLRVNGTLHASSGALRANGGNGGVSGNSQYGHVSGPGGGGGRVAILCGATAMTADQVLGRATGGLAVSAFGGLWGTPSFATPSGAGSVYAACGAATNTLLFRGNPAVTPASTVPSVLFLSDFGLCLSTLIVDTPSGLVVDSANPMLPTLLAAGTVVGGSVSARANGGATVVTGGAYACGRSTSTAWIPPAAAASLAALSNTLPVQASSYSRCSSASGPDAVVANCDPGSTIASISLACYTCSSSTVCPSAAGCTNGVSTLGHCAGRASCTAYWGGGDTCPGSGKSWAITQTCSATASGVIAAQSAAVAALRPPTTTATATASTAPPPAASAVPTPTAANVPAGSCMGIRLRSTSSSTTCIADGWCQYMPAVTELAAIDAAGVNVALSRRGSAASASSAYNDNGNCGCVPASAERTALYASYATDGLFNTSWQARGVGGGCCAQCACDPAPWLQVAFGSSSNVVALRMNITRTGSTDHNIAADIGALSGWALDVLGPASTTLSTITVQSAGAAVLTSTAAYWTWTLPSSLCAAVSASPTPSDSRSGTASRSPTASVSPSPPPPSIALNQSPAGASCASDAMCASGTCRGSVCCSPFAVRLGCSTCVAGTGACASLYPGEACASNFDCQTNLCAGGCCCASSALTTAGCNACTCWSSNASTAATAGMCAAPPPPPPAASVALQCGNATAVNASVAAAALITFPAALNVTDAAPLIVLPSTSYLNTFGEDVIVASASACSAYAALGGPTQCNRGRAFATDFGVMFYLGTAAALGMGAAPQCAV